MVEVRSRVVPYLGAARALVWLAVAGTIAVTTCDPAPVLESSLRVGADGECVLGPESLGPECPCEHMPARVRRVLGVPLSLERASAADLELLPDIGPERARAIVAERERGGFASVDALDRVPGIGPATLRKLAPHLFVGPDPACVEGKRSAH